MARPDVKKIIDDNLENIEQWTRDGLTMKQIASNLGISDRVQLGAFKERKNAEALKNKLKSAGYEAVIVSG